MLLKKGVDFNNFLLEVKQCDGEVLFETDEGDSLNLKSILSQYLFTVITADDNFLLQGHVVCSDESDYVILNQYLTNE